MFEITVCVASVSIALDMFHKRGRIRQAVETRQSSNGFIYDAPWYWVPLQISLAFGEGLIIGGIFELFYVGVCAAGKAILANSSLLA